MKRSFLLAVIAAAFISGCQTSTYVSSAANDGNGITCGKIYQAFDAYEQDRQSADALAQLSSLVSPAAGNYANMGVNSASRYYDQVKASANVALAVRGCQPVG